MRVELRRITFTLMLSQVFVFFFLLASAFAEQKPVLKGKIADSEGRALQGASVFIYDSPDTKRPVDLVSAQTGEDGLYHMTLPPGRYWVVARQKAAGKYGLGPLMPGDKFSGEPTELELAPGAERSVDFVLMDIMEYARQKKKIRADCVRIKGRLVDENGRPVRPAYAIANRQAKNSEMPDYLSAWTDEDGRYDIYLPRGKYHIGYATAFPPGNKYAIDRAVDAETDISNLDIIVKTAY